MGALGRLGWKEECAHTFHGMGKHCTSSFPVSTQPDKPGLEEEEKSVGQHRVWERGCEIKARVPGLEKLPENEHPTDQSCALQCWVVPECTGKAELDAQS